MKSVLSGNLHKNWRRRTVSPTLQSCHWNPDQSSDPGLAAFTTAGIFVRHTPLPADGESQWRGRRSMCPSGRDTRSCQVASQGSPAGEKSHRPQLPLRGRSRKCHVSRLRLRAQRLTGSSGRGSLGPLRLAAASHPGVLGPSGPTPEPRPQAELWSPGGLGRMRRAGLLAPPFYPASSPKSVAPPWLPAVVFQLGLGLSQTPARPYKRRRHVPARDTCLWRRLHRPPGPERGRLCLGVSLHER